MVILYSSFAWFLDEMLLHLIYTTSSIPMTFSTWSNWPNTISFVFLGILLVVIYHVFAVFLPAEPVSLLGYLKIGLEKLNTGKIMTNCLAAAAQHVLIISKCCGRLVWPISEDPNQSAPQHSSPLPSQTQHTGTSCQAHKWIDLSVYCLLIRVRCFALRIHLV